MMFEPPIYIENPSKLELIGRLQQFLAGKDARTFKVGLILPHKLKKRYFSTSIFKPLSNASIFCRAKVDIAEHIENEMKYILLEQGMCGNSNHDRFNIRLPDDNRSRFVYLAELKEDLASCPCPGCTYASTRSSVAEHIHSHLFLEKLIIIKRELKKRGIQTLDSYKTEPVPFVLVPFKNTKCRFCGLDHPGKTSSSAKSAHEVVCKMNPNPKYPCEHSACNMRFMTEKRLRTHQAVHKKKEEREAQNKPHKCLYCNLGFDHLRDKKMHEKRCPKNSSRKMFPCCYCIKEFATTSGKHRHERRCKENPQRKTLSSGESK